MRSFCSACAAKASKAWCAFATRPGRPAGTRGSGLVGPDGTEDLAKALESALSRSDAIIWTKTPPPGGFDIAPLVARDVPPGQGARVFDTGDLTVSAVTGGRARSPFNVGYDGRVLHLSPCEASRSRAAAADRHVGCYGESADLAWPLPQDDIVLNGD